MRQTVIVVSMPLPMRVRIMSVDVSRRVVLVTVVPVVVPVSLVGRGYGMLCSRLTVGGGACFVGFQLGIRGGFVCHGCVRLSESGKAGGKGRSRSSRPSASRVRHSRWGRSTWVQIGLSLRAAI